MLLALPALAQTVTKDSDTCINIVRRPYLTAFRGGGTDRPVLGLETSSGSVRDSLGVLIVGVSANGPADKAGIEEGDRIATANGIDLRLAASDAGDREMRGLMGRRLARAIQKVKAGDAVDLRVYHNGQYKTVKVTTVKASELADDDDFMQVGANDMNLRLLDVMPSLDHAMGQLNASMAGLRSLKALEGLKNIKIVPPEIIDDGIHRY